MLTMNEECSSSTACKTNILLQLCHTSGAPWVHRVPLETFQQGLHLVALVDPIVANESCVCSR